mgnify:FL=1
MNETTPSRPSQHGVALGVLLGLVLAVLIFGGLFSPDGAEWYRTLRRPAFQPPSWAFGVVWPILYVLMAVAAWRVWRRRGWCLAIAFWGVQLALNAAWSPVFFGAHSLVGDMVVIAALLAVLAATVLAFWRIDRLAGALLLPYLAWVAYASTLNAALLWLN